MRFSDFISELRWSKPVERTDYMAPKDSKTGQRPVKTVPSFAEPHFRPKEKVTSWEDRKAGNIKTGLTRMGAKGEGHVIGTVGDWLDLMGATRHDIVPAYAEVKQSPEYHQLIDDLDFQDISSRGDIANGTLTLQGEKTGILGSEQVGVPFRRKVLANGNIRAMAGSNYGGKQRVSTYHGWRPATYHPFTIENSPDLTPQERIVKSMRQSLKQLIHHYEGSSRRHFMHSLKKEPR